MTRTHENEQACLPAVFRGIDELSAAMWAVPLGVLALVLLAAGRPVYASTAMAAGAVLGLGSRYKCVVGPTGITLVRRAAFFWPLERHQFLLDASPRLYDSWESDRPEGVYFEGFQGTFEAESEVFGPYFSVAAQHQLLEAIAAALDRARALSSPPPDQLRFPALDEQGHALQVVERTAQGRPRRVVAREPIRLYAMEIPEASILHFNHSPFPPRWRDPRREDALWAVECSAPTILPWGLEVQEGARLLMNDHSNSFGVEDGFDGPVHHDGRWVDGKKPLRFDSRGKLVAYTLAEPVTIGELGVLPTGSHILHHTHSYFEGSAEVTLSAKTCFDGRVYPRGARIYLRAPWHVCGRHPRFELEQLVLDGKSTPLMETQRLDLDP